MVTSQAAIPVANQPDPPMAGLDKRKGQRWLELFLVLALTLGTSVYNALHILRYGMSPSMQLTTGTWIMGTAHELLSLMLLVYVLSRTARTLKDIGFRFSFRDVGVGAVLYAIAHAAYFVGGSLVGIGMWSLGIHPIGHGTEELFGGFSIFQVPFGLVNPFYEELIVRGYMMTEIQALTGSALIAVIASTLFQASYHLYYGWWTALSLMFQFLVLAVYYARSRRALPLIVAHGVSDLMGIVHLAH
jgi:membrane protease YdiL (CAAX protease family)